MSGFDFSTLNSTDFEMLVRDLLNAQERDGKSSVVYRIFKEGKDRGIDLLYSTPDSDYEIVGQVKHYYRSGVPALLSDLQKSEAAKVKKLQPNRYVFATSLELTAVNTQAIKNIFRPYIQTLSDVYDRNALNDLLSRFPDILRNHHKLWFSGTEVLRTILQYEIEGRSNEFVEDDLKKRLRLYVETPELQAARTVLDKNNFVIITGEPGVGKTTTAELLLYEKITEGYDLIYLYDDIKEAEKILEDRTRKVVFYFDDFLGHNSVEIEKARGSETALLKTLRRISLSDNKKFIFTTRTFILNHAIEGSERLRQFNLRAKESLISLAVYDNDLKLKLLNNHIEESLLGKAYKEVLQKPEIQNFIIRHQNFSPRSVEFITSSRTVSEISSDDFGKYIKENFNRPDEIWRHAYEQQIDDLSRLLLNTMVSFGNTVDVQRLEIAFNKRLDYETEYNNFHKPLHPFSTAFRRLENGFIIEDSHIKGQFTFINPSLVDFLVGSIRREKNEVTRIAEAAAYVEQLIRRLYTLDNVRTDVSFPDRLKAQIINHYDEFIYEETSDCDAVLLALLVYNYLGHAPLTIELIDKVNDWSAVQSDRETNTLFITFLETVDEATVIAFLKQMANTIFPPMLIGTHDIQDFVSLMNLAVSRFSFSLAQSPPDTLEDLNELGSSLLSKKIEEDVDELQGYSQAQDFVGEKEEESEGIKNELEGYGLTIKANFSEYNAYDWWEIGNQNYFDEQMAKDD